MDCGYVGGIEISAPQSGSVVATPMSGARHRHVNYLRSELRQLVQPRGRESARCCAFPVPPYGGADPRSVAELAVVDEIHPTTAPPPFTSLDPALYGLRAESGAAGLCECDDAVLFTQDVIQHSQWTLASTIWFRPLVISVRNQSPSDCLRTEIA